MPKTKGKVQKKRVYFKLHAEDAGQVNLVGNFNEWDIRARALKPDAKGRWRTFVSLEPGVYEYRFLVDGEWCNDPDADSLVRNAFGTENCVRFVS